MKIKLPENIGITMLINIGLLAIVLIALTGSMSFSAISTMLSKEIKTDDSYTIDTAGLNIRVYEFTTQTEPRMKCITTISDEKSPSTQCIKLK